MDSVVYQYVYYWLKFVVISIVHVNNSMQIHKQFVLSKLNSILNLENVM